MAGRVMQLMILHYLGTKTSLTMLPSTGYRANSSVFLLVMIPVSSITHQKKMEPKFSLRVRSQDEKDLKRRCHHLKH